MFGIKDIMEQAQQLQSRMESMKDELAGKTVTGSAGGGMVTAEVNGAQEVLSVKIEKDLLTGDDQEVMEDLIVAALNDALGKSREMVNEEVRRMTGGLKIPGLTDLA